jgi:hypothetical protein
LGRKYGTIILGELAQIFFFACSKLNSLKFCDIRGCKKARTTNFPPLSFVAVVGSGICGLISGIQDLRFDDKNQDSGSGIIIPDQQHSMNHKNISK